MDIEKIIKELIQNKIIQSKQTDYEQLNGGTVSELYLLHNDGSKYVVKSNDPLITKSESNFLHTYKEINMLPKLLFVEHSNRYIVYSYINGSTHYPRKNKKEMLQELVKELINNYMPIDQNIGWGWADEPTDSWRSFLKTEIEVANKWLGSRLSREDYHFIHNLVIEISNERKPFLIHGDCGVHNFIFNDGKLTGVIDPTPIIGDPIYDLIYAFCSSPDDLTTETIDTAASHLVVDNVHKSYFYEQVLIGLYLRIGTCVKHHPDDLAAYLKAWEYWKTIIMK
ncbi:aminoglycoside phosphotransferase family protein [Niallia sp.]|uniref:aminoglycoside phosphotransferase family protein n=1 Tax=Niallia sp. TaxID=2837523 RepID=UPI00289F46D9|nr:aminoglycoside phosphotransferase family protein [Niallia sp.]